MNNQQAHLLKVPLRLEAHKLARQFAAEQATPKKGKQVYLNTLAVCAVHNYLNLLQVETDLSQGHSWNPGIRALFNVADLVLPDIGKLECCPVLPGESAFSLPLEVTEDRIGYVAVQFNQSLNKVQLLGFVPAVEILDTSSQILIKDLQSLESLLSCIPSNVINMKAVLHDNYKHVKLGSWLQNVFDGGWQPVEKLSNIGASAPAFCVRSAELADLSIENSFHNSVVGISGGKLIDLGIQLVGHPLTLLITITPVLELEFIEEVDIFIQLFPSGGQVCLIPGLLLMVIDEFDAIYPELEAHSRSHDNWIQVQFSCIPGTRFSVKVALGDVSIIEYFVA